MTRHDQSTMAHSCRGVDTRCLCRSHTGRVRARRADSPAHRASRWPSLKVGLPLDHFSRRRPFRPRRFARYRGSAVPRKSVSSDTHPVAHCPAILHDEPKEFAVRINHDRPRGLSSRIRHHLSPELPVDRGEIDRLDRKGLTPVGQDHHGLRRRCRLGGVLRCAGSKRPRAKSGAENASIDHVCLR